MAHKRGLLGILVLLAAAPALGAAVLERSGYAYRAGDGELLYIEEHREWVQDGEVVKSRVTYRDAGGSVIATKQLDFSGVPTHPDFELNNRANGHIEGAEQIENGVRVFFRRTDDHGLEEKMVALPEQAIIDGGFDRFIELNWDKLLRGERFERPFLVPSFQRFVNFRIYLERQRGGDVIFVMEPASFLVRLVGEAIVVTYDAATGALKRYKGISNIRDQSGENYDVRVEFPAGERGRAGGLAASDG